MIAFPTPKGPQDILSMAGPQGWQDFADATTQTTPLEQSNISGGAMQFTTDNQGTLTDGNTTINGDHTLPGVNDIWVTTSNTIRFGGVGLITNDVIDARLHFEISSLIIPQNFKLVFEFFDNIDASGNKVFELVSEIPTIADNAGTYFERIIERRFFIGDSIKDGSCRIMLEGDSAYRLKIKGINLEIRRPSTDGN